METHPSVRVRMATQADLDAVVRLHELSFTPEEHLGTQFGRPFIRQSYRWFMASPKAVFVVAEVDGRLAGFLVAYNGVYHRDMYAQNWPAVLRGFVTRPWILVSPGFLKRVFSSLFGAGDADREIAADPGVAHFAFVAVDPGIRRGGIGTALMGRTIEECRARGLTRCKAVIYERNVSSRKMTEKFGFTTTPLPGTAKVLMELALTGRDT